MACRSTAGYPQMALQTTLKVQEPSSTASKIQRAACTCQRPASLHNAQQRSTRQQHSRQQPTARMSALLVAGTEKTIAEAPVADRVLALDVEYAHFASRDGSSHGSILLAEVCVVAPGGKVVLHEFCHPGDSRPACSRLSLCTLKRRTSGASLGCSILTKGKDVLHGHGRPVSDQFARAKIAWRSGELNMHALAEYPPAFEPECCISRPIDDAIL